MAGAAHPGGCMGCAAHEMLVSVASQASSATTVVTLMAQRHQDVLLSIGACRAARSVVHVL